MYDNGLAAKWLVQVLWYCAIGGGTAVTQTSADAQSDLLLLLFIWRHQQVAPVHHRLGCLDTALESSQFAIT